MHHQLPAEELSVWDWEDFSWILSQQITHEMQNLKSAAWNRANGACKAVSRQDTN